jgi:pilus assembly protein CpaE
MSSVANLQPEPAPILACTVSRDVRNFDLLIDDMEIEMGECWGDLTFDEARAFLAQPDSDTLEFICVAVDGQDETDLSSVVAIVKAAKERGVKVILIADHVSPAGLHQLLRLGAEDFVPYPLPEGALHEAIDRLRKAREAAALAEALAAEASAVPAAPVVQLHPVPDEAVQHPSFKAKGDRNGVVLPIHGLSGGTGSSTFATNLAWELATISKTDAPRVCLLDFDFQYGSIATYLDLPRKEAVFEVLSDTAAIDSDAFLQAMLTYNDRLHVLTAPADMLPLDIVAGEDIARIIEMAQSNFDFVVIDMPKTIVAWTETVLSRAHVYFSMIDLDLRSAQNVLRLVRALKAETLPHEKLRFVLNRAPKFTDLAAKSRVKRMAESLEIKMELQLPDGGHAVTQANDHGQPLAEAAAKNPLRKEIQKLAKSLYDLNRAVEAATSR